MKKNVENFKLPEDYEMNERKGFSRGLTREGEVQDRPRTRNLT